MKRKLNTVIALILALVMFVSQTMFTTIAISDAVISVSNVEAQPGDTVDVTVNITNNPGVTSVLLTIGYDSSVFTLIGVTDGGILGSAFHSNKYQNPYTLSWANDTATTNITNNGTAVTLKFKVAENAILKNYSITVSYDFDNYEIIDKDMNPISFGLVNGSIDVKAAACKHTNTTTVAAKASTCLEQGNSAYILCNDCGVVVSGSDAKLPLGDCSFDEWITVKETTCTVAGEQRRTCLYCLSSEVREIPAIGHDFANGGSCLICGMQNSMDVATITVASSSVSVGSQAKVAVSLKNNPGITSMLLKVHYDTNKLELSAVEDSGNLGSAFHSNNYKNPYTLSWANDTVTSNYTYNGEIVVLTFNVKDDAALGETPINITYEYDNYDIIDKDMNPVEFAVVNGSIDVKAAACKHTNTTTVAAKASTCLEQGNSAYILCNDCGVVVSGSDAKLPLGDCSFDEWTIVKEATYTEEGRKIRTCSVCKKVESEVMPKLEGYLFKEVAESTVINEENKTIYGLEEGVYDLEGYVEYEGCELEYNPTAFGFGTGTTVDIIVDGEVVDTYTIVIFGDINGDGYVDAFDVPAVMAFVNYESQYESGSAQELASDINGDGFVDESDLFLADLASAFAYTIEQSR